MIILRRKMLAFAEERSKELEAEIERLREAQKINENDDVRRRNDIALATGRLERARIYLKRYDSACPRCFINDNHTRRMQHLPARFVADRWRCDSCALLISLEEDAVRSSTPKHVAAS